MSTHDLDPLDAAHIPTAALWTPRLRELLLHLERGDGTTAVRVFRDQHGSIRIGVWCRTDAGDWVMTRRSIRLRRAELLPLAAALDSAGRRHLGRRGKGTV